MTIINGKRKLKIGQNKSLIKDGKINFNLGILGYIYI
jgi:hypothetical protein